MPDRIFTDFNGDQVILSANVLMSIITKHPETSTFKIGVVLVDPDQIRASNHDERCFLYSLCSRCTRWEMVGCCRQKPGRCTLYLNFLHH